MNLKEYYKKQRILDKYIMETKGLVQSELITQKKIIAFKQEFGELLQRLPEVFKFWSNKKNILDNETLEEWCDGFHFLLSIGNDMRYDELITDIEPTFKDYYIPTLVARIYRNYITSYTDYKEVFEMYLSFILALGYTEAEIRTAYDTKNAENFARQERGY